MSHVQFKIPGKPLRPIQELFTILHNNQIYLQDAQMNILFTAASSAYSIKSLIIIVIIII